MVCTKCGIEKPEEEFYLRKDRGKRRGECRQCGSEAKKKYHRKRDYSRKNDFVICSKCGKTKGLSEYRKGRNVCKACTKKYAHEYNQKIKQRGRDDVLTCTSCKEQKPKKEFPKIAARCKKCVSIYRKQYNEKNKERIKLKYDKDKKAAYNKIYRELNLERIKQKTNEYNFKNKAYLKEKAKIAKKIRLKNEPLYALRRSISNRVYQAMRGTKAGKSVLAMGINVAEILKHHGQRPTSAHQLDHILPMAAFDYSKELHIAASWHHSNLQWLTAKENREKGDKYSELEFKRYLAWFERNVWSSLQLTEQTG